MQLAEILTAQLEHLSTLRGGAPLSIIETGSIRGETPEYETNDGWSTLAFARYVAAHGGRVCSIDLDTSHARAVLEAHGLEAELIQSDSVVALAALLQAGMRADLILLDSANDAALIFQEFRLARRLLRGATSVVVIDDVVPGSEGIVKGHDVMRWLDEQELQYAIVTRNGDAYSTGVLVVSGIAQ